MKKNILYLILFLSTTMVYAQDEYELKDNEDFGYIVDKDGKNTEGIVRLAEDADSPWTNQKKVKFIPSAEIDKTKKRQKFKTLDIDDIKEYVAYDDGE